MPLAYFPYTGNLQGWYSCACLSTDAKPVSPPDDCVLYEIDTGKQYRAESGAWVEKTNATYYQNLGVTVSPATTGTINVPILAEVVTITPTGACLFNAPSGGIPGRFLTFYITTSGTASFIMTFGTNFRKVTTLATGTTSGRFFTVTFRCVATNIFAEISRSGPMT